MVFVPNPSDVTGTLDTRGENPITDVTQINSSMKRRNVHSEPVSVEIQPTSTAYQIFDYNPGRAAAILSNMSSAVVYVGIGNTDVTTGSEFLQLAPNTYLEMPDPAFRQRVTVMWDNEDTTTGSLTVTELF